MKQDKINMLFNVKRIMFVNMFYFLLFYLEIKTESVPTAIYHGLPPGQGPPSGWSEPASSLACDCNRTTFIEGFSYCFLLICCVIMLSS